MLEENIAVLLFSKHRFCFLFRKKKKKRKKWKRTRNKNLVWNTLSQYPGWIHPEEFPGENLIHKITPQWNAFGFFTSMTVFHNLLHPGPNTVPLIVLREFLNFTRWVLILPLWHYWYSLLLGVWQHLVGITAIHDKSSPGNLG